MRKLKGITINGEWMGDNVAINGLFRAICTISPYVMQEFIRLINRIDTLDEAVHINKFSFPDNNTIEIEFSNNKLHGLANLIFRLQNGTPVLVDGKLVLPQEEDNAELSNKVELMQEEPLEEEVSNVDSEEICLDDTTQETLQQEVAATGCPEAEENSNVEVEEQKSEQNQTEEICEEDVPVELEPTPTSENIDNTEEDLADFYEDNDTEIPQEETVEEVAESKQPDISAFVDELVNRVPDLSAFAKPIQIQVIQPNIPAAEPPAPKEEKKIEFIENNINLTESRKETPKEEKEIQKEEKAVVNIPEEKNIESLQNEIEESVEETADINEPALEEAVSIQPETTDLNEDVTDEEDTSSTAGIEEDLFVFSQEENQEEQFENEEGSTADTILETSLFEDGETVNQEVSQEEFSTAITEDVPKEIEAEDESQIENDETSENIDECLADFYTTEAEDKPLEVEVKDSIAMQAMLNEVMVLREELSKLKQKEQEEAIAEEQAAAVPKPTVEEFFGDYRVPYEINDDEADFKIMGNGARINASILDEDMFIAGDKLYRWGETLYLEE